MITGKVTLYFPAKMITLSVLCAFRRSWQRREPCTISIVHVATKKKKSIPIGMFIHQKSASCQGVVVRQVVESYSLSQPDPTLNPVLHHHAKTIMNKREEEHEDDIFTLSLSRTTTEHGKATLQAISLQLPTMNTDTTISNNNRKKLITIFQLLHPVIVLSSKQTFQHRYECVSSDSESGKTLFDAASIDDTCLYQCIYSLSTGKFPSSTSEIATLQSTRQKNLLVQIFGIAEMIRSQCVWKGRSILKYFVGQQLMINCASNSLYKILNQIGVSSSNETVRVGAIKGSKNKILAGYPLAGKKYDLFLILFDNLGFRVRGGKNLKVGYDQYTALELVNIPKDSLIEWGVYPDKQNNKPGNFLFKNFQYTRMNNENIVPEYIAFTYHLQLNRSINGS